MTSPRLLVIVLLVGCAPRVGSDCPTEASERAATVVYRRDGLPAYAGQALMITSCGADAFCHSVGATERFGTPYDLNLVPQLADEVGDDANGAALLRGTQVRIRAMREEIYGAVYANEMPPGPLGAAALAPPYGTFDATGAFEPMPGLDTAIGRDVLRNWLACGAPVIERASSGLGSATRCSADADCPLTGTCDLRALRCVPVGTTVPALSVHVDATWSSLHEVIVETRCARSLCHAGAEPAGGLDLSDEADSLELLLRESADEGGDCDGQGRYLVPGDPDHSLFYRKLTIPGSRICGAQMPSGSHPLAEPYLTAFRDWIMAGAPP